MVFLQIPIFCPLSPFPDFFGKGDQGGWVSTYVKGVRNYLSAFLPIIVRTGVPFDLYQWKCLSMYLFVSIRFQGAILATVGRRSLSVAVSRAFYASDIEEPIVPSSTTFCSPFTTNRAFPLQGGTLDVICCKERLIECYCFFLNSIQFLSGRKTYGFFSSVTQSLKVVIVKAILPNSNLKTIEKFFNNIVLD